MDRNRILTGVSIAGLRNVSWKPKEILYRSAVIRGAEVTVEVQDGHFADEGDICLFGLVLSEFFAAYATINSFVHLHIVTKPSETTITGNHAKGICRLSEETAKRVESPTGFSAKDICSVFFSRSDCWKFCYPAAGAPENHPT